MLCFQLSETFSHLTFMFTQMLFETGKFTPLMFVTVLSYSLYLCVLNVVPINQQNLSLTHANESEQELTEDILTTFYHVFLWTYAGKTPDDIYFTNSAIPALSLFGYIIIVLECSLLFLNLLIAIFSHQVEDVYNYQIEIQTLLRLLVILEIRDYRYILDESIMFVTNSKNHRKKQYLTTTVIRRETEEEL